ncbi:SCO family protein [Halococcus thailandensis]
MQRREYLQGAMGIGVASVATGCLGLTETNENVVLDEPDRKTESSDLPYPAWNEKIPDVTLPKPLTTQETVTLRNVDKPRLVEFFYSHCQTVCPVLTSTMRNIQTHSLNNGYGDQIEFFPITFDPERDDAKRLSTYADEMNINTDAKNWQFLRPKSKDRAKSVITDKFGFKFSRTHPENMDMYMFAHMPLILLVNADDYVERAYTSKSPDAEKIISNLKTIRNA